MKEIISIHSGFERLRRRKSSAWVDGNLILEVTSFNCFFGRNSSPKICLFMNIILYFTSENFFFLLSLLSTLIIRIFSPFPDEESDHRERWVKLICPRRLATLLHILLLLIPIFSQPLLARVKSLRHEMIQPVLDSCRQVIVKIFVTVIAIVLEQVDGNKRYKGTTSGKDFTIKNNETLFARYWIFIYSASMQCPQFHQMKE